MSLQPQSLSSAGKANPAQLTECWACQSLNVFPLFELCNVPISCNIPQRTYESARSIPRGHIRLGVCNDCGHLYNLTFDPSLLLYMPGYENSLGFSPHFQRYLKSLALGLIEKHSLRQKHIVEIACGTGEFLQLLCELGDNSGVGFDPSHNGTQPSSQLDITFVAEPFPGRLTSLSADFIACRHALEHIEKPREFLQKIRRILGNRPDVNVYFEVPNSLFTVRDHSVWDILYEHCSYFCVDSLIKAFTRTGFEVTDAWEGYDGQFIGISAHPSTEDVRSTYKLTGSYQTVIDHAVALQQSYRQKIDFWEKKLFEIAKLGKKAVVWGAGSKGVMFLNSVDQASNINYVIDINPKKHGWHVSGGGQEIVGPEVLKEYPVDYIIVMNRIYKEEIRALLEEMHLQAEVITA